MNHMPPFKDLRVFTCVAHCGGFKLAAQQLAVSPAYVSKRIALLEETLGTQLLLRSARQVSLTREGEITLRWAQSLLSDMAQLQGELNREQQVPAGRLRITTSTGFGTRCVAPVLSHLVSRYPLLDIELELLDRPVDLVSEGFDLELLVGGEPAPDLIARRLASNRRILCAAPSYLARAGTPTRLDELRQHRCIGIRERDQSDGHWHLASGREVYRLQPRAWMSTNNGDVARQWCLDGHGIMLRSLWNVQRELASGALRQVLPEFSQPADIYAVYTRRLDTSARLRACVDLLAAELPALCSWPVLP